jgi:hypothetical protein
VGVVKALVVVALVLAACSVPGVTLEGKQCPCTDGFTCNTATNTCHANDASIDVPPGSSCLGAEAARLFSVDFNDNTLHLTPGLGTWTASGGQAQQTDAATAFAFAYSTSAVPSDYRVAATVIPASGAAGVVFRNALGSKTMYYCDWNAGTGKLVLGYTNNGGNPTQITSVTATPSSGPVTIHAEAKGTNLSCCLDEVPAAKLLMVPDTRYPNGQPGLSTEAGSAAFDDLVVSALPI